MNKLNFHQTFPPTLEYLSRLLDVSDMANELTKEEISELTGIPTGKSSGKVEPHIYYAIYMGLVDNVSSKGGRYMLRLTKLGELVKQEDLGFNEEVTQLLCHCRLTSPSTGAFLWRLIIRNILPKYPNGLKFLLLEDELKKHIKSGLRLGPFYTTYERSFDSFNLIKRTKENIRAIPQTQKDELLYVYAYTLLYEWEQIFPQYNEITADQLSSLKFAEAFGLIDSEAYNILVTLMEKQIIRINGQLSPFTLIKNFSSDMVLEKTYSLLH